MSQLTNLNTITGEGKPGPACTVGAQAVEVEYDTKDHTYRLVKLQRFNDIGRLINPNATGFHDKRRDEQGAQPCKQRRTYL
jgi:CO/xanthine dehydrogenase Mo-binding subunit